MEIRLGNQQRHSIVAVIMIAIMVLFAVLMLEQRNASINDPVSGLSADGEPFAPSAEPAGEGAPAARSSSKFSLPIGPGDQPPTGATVGAGSNDDGAASTGPLVRSGGTSTTVASRSTGDSSSSASTAPADDSDDSVPTSATSSTTTPEPPAPTTTTTVSDDTTTTTVAPTSSTTSTTEDCPGNSCNSNGRGKRPKG